MSNGFGLENDLERHIGQTVTIFTTSGGQSGRGFTGVLASVNCRFVRLILQLGSAPGCALGNCCEEERENDSRRRCTEFNEFSSELGEGDRDRNRDRIRNTNRNRNTDRIDCSGRTLGAIVDIPVDRIAAFVHNAVGSSGW